MTRDGTDGRRGERSRTLILDAAERLMAERGYAATSIASLCKATGLPATSIYWHFSSKEGVLAAVMERGALRWFAALPTPAGVGGEPVEALLSKGADAVAGNPSFLRLFYLLALEGEGDQVARELVRSVRDHAFAYFRELIEAMLTPAHGERAAQAAAGELARFAVAASDGFFFALQLEPDEADLHALYRRLATAVGLLVPTVLAEIQPDGDA